MTKKSAISLISYDADYLPHSIKRYYNYVDEIILGLDEDRITWSGNKFSFDESALYKALKSIDKDNKISIVEDNFHKSTIAIENDNYERNFLKAQCSYDWVFSFDADEILLNAKDFFYNFCPIVKNYMTTKDICMTWVTPYKHVEDNKVLLISNEDGTPFFGEDQGVVTHKDSTYVYARWTDKSARGDNRIKSPLVALHWSLCRNQKELLQKITNTGHSDIAEKDPFYNIWKDVDIHNYKELKNFKTSGLGGMQWPRLVAVDADKLESHIINYINEAYP